MSNASLAPTEYGVTAFLSTAWSKASFAKLCATIEGLHPVANLLLTSSEISWTETLSHSPSDPRTITSPELTGWVWSIALSTGSAPSWCPNWYGNPNWCSCWGLWCFTSISCWSFLVLPKTKKPESPIFALVSLPCTEDLDIRLFQFESKEEEFTITKKPKVSKIFRECFFQQNLVVIYQPCSDHDKHCAV